MIDNWFKRDLDKIYKTHKIAVFLDESTEGSFLLETFKDDVVIYTVTSELEELKAKYEIEKSRHNGSKYLIYSSTPKKELKFIREYCETNGCVEIKYLENYIKQKVNQYLNLNLNLPKEELISAAKVSIGRDQTYWMDLSHKGSSEIFDLERELLPFLDNPKNFVKKFDSTTQEIFYKKICELIEQVYSDQPAQTLATEVVTYMLSGLWNNNVNPTLLSVYKNWLDSVSYQNSFHRYLEKYKQGNKETPFEIHPSHPFEKIDRLWLKEIGMQIENKDYIQSVLPKINQRNANQSAKRLDITFWKDVKVLLEFDEKNINQISSFGEAVDFYLEHFYKLDGAIRKLYSAFLTEKDLIEPFQNYYKNLVTIYLDKWFRYIDGYQSNQTGVIQEIIDQHNDKTAIVVGDGVSWEFSQDIISAIGTSEHELTKKHIFAGLPSETEHNMSQLYVQTGDVLATKKERENYLVKTNEGKDITFIDLENVNETTDTADYLICSYKDPDKLGETYQQKALKYFDQVAETFAQKIKQLLNNGYNQVYLVTDHGFTLTGILENSDKIEVSFIGPTSKSERYIRTKKQQTIDNDLLVEKGVGYKDFEYCYFSKRLGPFKTPGVYGFSHGGLSPQETLIPYYKWSRTGSGENKLEVKIENKGELENVTGDLYNVKLKGNGSSDDLFSAERKVFLLTFCEGKKLTESDIFTVYKDVIDAKEYRFGNFDEIELKVLDATTREQLDKTIIKRNNARDMGGLL